MTPLNFSIISQASDFIVSELGEYINFEPVVKRGGFPYDPLFVRHGVYIRDIYPFIALRTRGKFKDLFIFEYHKDYGHKVDKLYSPYNPRSEAQQRWRGYFYAAITAWHALDDVTKHYYDTWHKWENRHGINKFMHLYLMQIRDLYYN